MLDRVQQAIQREAPSSGIPLATAIEFSILYMALMMWSWEAM